MDNFPSLIFNFSSHILQFDVASFTSSMFEFVCRNMLALFLLIESKQNISNILQTQILILFQITNMTVFLSFISNENQSWISILSISFVCNSIIKAIKFFKSNTRQSLANTSDLSQTNILLKFIDDILSISD